MSYAQPTQEYVDHWDYELPSVNESKSAIDDDYIEDGLYHFEITDISPPLPNNFGDKERRALTFRVMAGGTPEDVGKRMRQYFTLSTHPKSNLYPVFRAAAGGDLDPTVRPKLVDLRNAQVQGLVVHEEDQNGTKKQVIKTYMPVKSQIAPF